MRSQYHQHGGLPVLAPSTSSHPAAAHSHSRHSHPASYLVVFLIIILMSLIIILAYSHLPSLGGASTTYRIDVSSRPDRNALADPFRSGAVVPDVDPTMPKGIGMHHDPFAHTTIQGSDSGNSIHPHNSMNSGIVGGHSSYTPGEVGSGIVSSSSSASAAVSTNAQSDNIISSHSLSCGRPGITKRLVEAISSEEQRTLVRVPSGIVVATRFWATQSDDHENLHAFLERSVQYAQHVLVAVRIELDRYDTVQYIQRLAKEDVRFRHVQAVPVSPWNLYTPALNAMLNIAARMHDNPDSSNDSNGGDVPVDKNAHQHTDRDGNAEYILFQSIEVHATVEHVRQLAHHMSSRTLVVGGALLPHGQEFSTGIHRINGIVTPWNTFSLWHIKSLAKLGFLSSSDGTVTADAYAIEELTVISVLQHLVATGAYSDPSLSVQLQAQLTSDRVLAKLLRLDDKLEWSMPFYHGPDTLENVRRREYHTRIMKTKVPRAKKLLQLIGVPPGFVQHIDTRGQRTRSHIDLH
jgi:hypothetical protein